MARTLTPSTSSIQTGRILVVDDTAANVRLLERLLVLEGYSVYSAEDGQAAIEMVMREHPDLVLMDVRMPRCDGFEACRILKERHETCLIPVVLMTGLSERADRIRAIEAGADDFLTKPIDAAELTARVRSLVRLKRYTDDLDSAEAVITSLALTVEARDAYTDGHCQRLSRYGVAVGRRLHLPDDDLAALHRGGYLHDIGKIGIPDVLLMKPGSLTNSEFEVIKTHTVIGDRLCGNLRALSRVRPIVRHHHERLDGSGYPDGLEGDAIPLLAQIIGIVDIYDALTTGRPYKRAWPPELAFEELLNEARKGWRRRDLVDLLIAAGKDGELR